MRKATREELDRLRRDIDSQEERIRLYFQYVESLAELTGYEFQFVGQQPTYKLVRKSKTKSK